jgi:uncharacterized protein (TIGR02266 family)
VPAEALPAGVERRVDLRVKTSLRVRVRLAGLEELQTLWAMDISRGGVFIALRNPPRLHTEIALEIAVGAEATLELFGKVVHRVAAGAGAGMGVQFTELTDESRAALERLVAEADRLYGAAVPKPEGRSPVKGEVGR